jgi:hypothetical protein
MAGAVTAAAATGAERLGSRVLARCTGERAARLDVVTTVMRAR